MESRRILLGVSGSIAAYKAAELARLLRTGGFQVQVAMTKSAKAFITPLTFEALTGRPVLDDLFASRSQIEHVEQAHDVDLVLVAPASANVIARMALGIADDMLTTIVLATRARLVVAPAMESGMWENEATQDNLRKLQARGAIVLGPASGPLASGREGLGRMLEPSEIARSVERLLFQRSLAGERILITAGPTWEPIDPVRVLTNRSTGSMGIALAGAAAARGAEVRLVLGPTLLEPPNRPGLTLFRVETAQEMLAVAEREARDCSIFVASAAVSDFRPVGSRSSKLKRTDPSARTLALEENPDVLQTIARAVRSEDRRTKVIGFSAETENLEANARGKLENKGCDLVIANIVGKSDGFGPGETKVLAVSRRGPAVAFGPATKGRVADFVLDQIEGLGKQSSE